MISRLLLTICVVLLTARLGLAVEPSAADLDFFEKKIRPLLVKHCVECHGGKEVNGNLRLDTRAGTMAGGDQGPLFQLGKPDQSLLLKVVRYEDQDLQMPPDGKLKPEQIADLAEWVKRGVPWPAERDTGGAAKSKEMVFTPAMKGHWAFQPRQQVNVPDAGAANPIDNFIAAKIAAARKETPELKLAPRAEARTLIRRLTFDLTGLPPSPERVAAFVAAYEKDSERATQQLVQELLESPQYGEQWARHWLDVARYADSNGSEVDHAMANAWRYRDYVVGALNRDLPYDQFVREQLAGDLIPGSPLEATGFLMLGPKALAELDKAKLRADVIDEQLDTASRAFMGLTLGCCRCHDHKFDPLPTADYYALAGIFGSTNSMDYSKRVASWSELPLQARDKQTVENLMANLGDLRKKRDAADIPKDGTKPALTFPAKAEHLLIEAEHFTRGNVRVETDNLGRGIGVLRTLMDYPDHIEYEIEVATAGDYQLELRYAAKESRPVEITLNGNLIEMQGADQVTGDWTPAKQRWFVQGTYPFKAGINKLVFHRDGPVPLFDKLLIGKPRDKAYGPEAKPAPVMMTAGNKLKRELDDQITAVQRELETLPAALAPKDGPGEDAAILIRGNPALRGEIVPRGYPRIIGNLGQSLPTNKASGRRELAEWITRPEHPLTARVIVNRVWQWHFGQGLVASPDNFGLRGEAPSHPELLDWLANRFVADGWSLKKLHKLICTSETYRRAAPRGPIAGDSENRLLTHFPRRRLTAEELRDAILAASGKLDLERGGTVMTVLNRTYANGGNAPADIVEQMHYDTPRRTIYLPIIRSKLHDLLAAFDYPDPGMLTGQRNETTVAPQALYLLNSPFIKAQAAALAERVTKTKTNERERLQFAYELLFVRAPTDQETKTALEFLAGESKSGSKNDAAVWTSLCHSLLLSPEFLYLR